MQHSDKIVRAAKAFVFRKTFGSAQLLLALPERDRELCIRALAIIKQAGNAKGNDNEQD